MVRFEDLWVLQHGYEHHRRIDCTFPIEVIEMKRGKPVFFLECVQEKQRVNNADRKAGKGKPKKRMPFCNEADTG